MSLSLSTLTYNVVVVVVVVCLFVGYQAWQLSGRSSMDGTDPADRWFEQSIWTPWTDKMGLDWVGLGWHDWVRLIEITKNTTDRTRTAKIIYIIRGGIRCKMRRGKRFLRISKHFFFKL